MGEEDDWDEQVRESLRKAEEKAERINSGKPDRIGEANGLGMNGIEYS